MKVLRTSNNGYSQQERKKPSSAALLRSIIQSPTGINIWSVDRELKYTFFNHSHKRDMERFWGKQIHIGDPFLDAITEPGFKTLIQGFFQTIFSGKEVSLTNELVGDDNEIHFFDNHGNVIIDEDGEVTGATVFSIDISDRVRYERELQRTAHEKQILLKEIHHRVKNNLQIVSSLLSIQSMTVRSAKDRQKFTDSQNRILAMASIHEMLYHSESLSHIDMNGYIDSLLRQIDDSLVGDRRIDFRTDIEPICVSIDTAVPFGLIATELITNSLKHAFPEGNEGLITISLKKADSGESEFIIRDNGRGFSRSTAARKKDSLGLQIVDAMVSQLKGSFNMRRDHGTVCTVRFTPPPCNGNPVCS